MDEKDYRARELELQERRLAFEREKFLTEQERQPKPRRGLAGVFTAGLLTALAPLAGVFLDLQQADRQDFESRLNNLRDGYAFYFGFRQKLKEEGDAGDLEAVVRTMSTAFPEAFCGVRPDLHRLALSRGASQEENAALVGSILALDQVRPLQSRTGSLVAELAPWRKGRERMIVCDPIVSGAMAPAPETAPIERAKPLEKKMRSGALADAASVAAAAADEFSSAAPELAPASRGYTVYLHVNLGAEKDVLGPERPYLGERGYHIAAGVAVSPFPIGQGLVRYYREEQKADAEALAAWLTQKFAATGGRFSTKAVPVPGGPDDILDIWLPAEPSPPPARRQ